MCVQSVRRVRVGCFYESEVMDVLRSRGDKWSTPQNNKIRKGNRENKGCPIFSKMSLSLATRSNTSIALLNTKMLSCLEAVLGLESHILFRVHEGDSLTTTVFLSFGQNRRPRNGQDRLICRSIKAC